MSEDYNVNRRSINKLLGSNHTYDVPSYQRSYAWDMDNAGRLFEDLVETSAAEQGTPNATNLLGAMVVLTTNVDSAKFEVVDGQQRLATLSLIFSSMRTHLHQFKSMQQSGMGPALDDALNDLSDILEIKDGGPRVTLGESDSKLFREIIANKNHDYLEFCKMLRDKYQNGRKRIAESHRLLINNYRILCEKTDTWMQEFKLQEAIDQKDGDSFSRSVNELKKRIRNMREHNHFAFVEVHKRYVAYKIFNTFNSLGQRLSQADLVKSHLLSIVESDDRIKRDIKNRWQKIFDERLQDHDHFLYESLSSRYPTGKVDDIKIKITMDNMFRIIELHVKDIAGAEKYIDELDTDSKFIKQMDYPEDLSDEPQYNKIKSDLYGIRLLNARYIRVPILAACRRWDGLKSEDLHDLVDCLLVFFFKFKFINDGTAEDVRSIANMITKKIENKETIPDLIYTILINEERENPKKRIDDTRFADNFAQKMFKLTKNTAKYILASIEIYTRNEMKQECVYPTFRFELEHILPLGHQKHWDEKNFLGQNPEGTDISKYKNRLGNLTLLSKKWNLSLGAKGFSVKRDNEKNGYAKSVFEINKKYLKEYNEWTATTLLDRENALCGLASKVWSLDKYDVHLRAKGYKDPSGE